MTDHLYTNALIDESSPYLLQHAHNPVDWYPWGEEALARAKMENKMLLISIGYAACHWCHVMEHESFEDSLVAAVMNENFICIKVDREERPDVDDVYMTACQLASGRGCGWPLNAFALPDGRPVWAGTYFPKDQWVKILTQFGDMHATDLQRLEEAADKITKGIAAQGSIEVNTEEILFNQEDLQIAAADMLSGIDMEDGGRQGAPKFPMPNNYQLLLKLYHLTGNERLLRAATVTLDKMAKGGIYDQLGGGFARYSVDSYWLAPHFEKMLYDNGQLLSLYSQAYKLTADPLYRKIIQQTIEWAEREMRDDAGGYYSSLDADSEGVEGKFYVWSKAEIDSLLQDDHLAKVYCDYYSVTSSGNWEHTNILYPQQTKKEVANRYELTIDELDGLVAQGDEILLAHRATRIRPGTDDKVLTSWNALMITGLVDAYTALGDPAYLQMALRVGGFIRTTQMQEDFRLYRNYKDGKSAINGFLDDYAATIQAFVMLYQTTLDHSWLEDATALQAYVDGHFANKDHGMYNYTSDLDPPLIARKSELTDNVIPSSSSMTARNLLMLGHYLYRDDYIEQAQSMLHNISNQAIRGRQPSYYSNWLQLYVDVVSPPYEVAIIGPDAPAKAASILAQYLPNILVLGSTQEEHLELLQQKYQAGKTMIYVCQNKACRMPTEDVTQALSLIQ